MTGLNLIPIQDAIAEYVREQFPNYTVYEDIIIDDDIPEKVNGKIVPYIVLRWGGHRRLATNGSFGGVRMDEYVSSVDVNAIAPTPSQARRLSNILFDKLVGYKVDGIAPMVPDSASLIWAVGETNAKPTVYVASFGLSYAINFDEAGAYITP